MAAGCRSLVSPSSGDRPHRLRRRRRHRARRRARVRRGESDVGPSLRARLQRRGSPAAAREDRGGRSRPGTVRHRVPRLPHGPGRRRPRPDAGSPRRAGERHRAAPGRGRRGRARAADATRRRRPGSGCRLLRHLHHGLRGRLPAGATPRPARGTEPRASGFSVGASAARRPGRSRSAGVQWARSVGTRRTPPRGPASSGSTGHCGRTAPRSAPRPPELPPEEGTPR